MSKLTTFGLIIFTIHVLHLFNPCFACNKVKKLGDVKKVEMDKIFCEIGTGGCDFDVKQVTCHNTGTVNADGKIKWDCRTPIAIKFPYRFGLTNVYCEYNNRDHYPGQRPDSYFRGEPKCKLYYSVEYVGDTFAVGVLVGLLCTLIVFKVYKGLWSLSSSSESRRVVKEIVYEGDQIWEKGPPKTGESKVVVNLDKWTGRIIFDKGGRGERLTQSCRRRRGTHSTGGKSVEGNSWNGVRTSGNFVGDMGIYEMIESKKEINEDCNWPAGAVGFDHGTSFPSAGDGAGLSSN